MNDLEGFKAVVHFERSDYVPIFRFPGSPGVSLGAMAKTHRRLVETGMPEYIVYDVRDRKSWKFYRDKMTPGSLWPADRIERECQRFDNRDRPLAITGGLTWGFLRSLMGPEKACTILYDDAVLAHEIINWRTWIIKTY